MPADGFGYVQRTRIYSAGFGKDMMINADLLLDFPKVIAFYFGDR